MNERVYKTMESVGAGCIVVGILAIVSGITLGVISIVSGGRLLKRKSDITI
ncbi:MAG TPA: hypothetical protein IAC41_03535 [Candidatus Merdenecus merdavium]|nr:hypothetical protein [Candidatus Merdenecus merdavium]